MQINSYLSFQVQIKIEYSFLRLEPTILQILQRQIDAGAKDFLKRNDKPSRLFYELLVYHVTRHRVSKKMLTKAR